MTVAAPSAAPSADALSGGFADPPVEAARAFRALLDAMSRPGRIETPAGARPPAPLGRAAGAAALTLCDAETPVWLAPAWRGADLSAWLRFHCNAPLTEDPGAAAFAFGPPEALLEALPGFAFGAPEAPQDGCTLVAEIAAFDGAALRLTGPGVNGAADLPLGADRAAVLALFAPNAFPLGRDLILTCVERLAALPRSAALSEV